MYHKSRVFRIHQRKRAIARKKRISKLVYHSDFYECDGQYNKGKVHCSCDLCRYVPEHDTKRRVLEKIAKKEINSLY